MRTRSISSLLLAWYDDHARDLPWRIGPADRRRGIRPDPYQVWLSEIMLQQTTVATVTPYFHTFVAQWPDLPALGGADQTAIMRAWAGLGYYSRARNLIACARIILDAHGGMFPDDPGVLQKLPGIGPYTAAAIAAIAFDKPVAAVDGNVERVAARLFAVTTALPKAKNEIKNLMTAQVPARRPGEFAEALMDLGATVCTPRSPDCGRCPLESRCAARAQGKATHYPIKGPRRRRPVRTGVAYVVMRDDGAVLLRRRPANGLLGGMVEVPGSAWQEPGDTGPPSRPPLTANWRALPVPVEHGFTHFSLSLTVKTATVPRSTAAPEGSWWTPKVEIGSQALPVVMRKVIQSVLDSSR